MKSLQGRIKSLRQWGLLLTFGLLAGAFLGSCSTPHYAVQSNHAPLLKEKGEVKVEGGATIHPRTMAYDIRGAYAPVENLQVMLSTAAMERSVVTSEFNATREQQAVGMKGVYTEGAVGYFGEFGYVNGAVNIGYGFANAVSRGPNSIMETSLTYGRAFIQPTLGVREDNVEWINSLRLSRLTYYSVASDSIASRSTGGSYGSIYDDYGIPVEQGNYLMMEPSSAILLGFNQLKFKLQLTLAVPLQDYSLSYDGLGIGVGLVYNFRPSTAEQGFRGD